MIPMPHFSNIDFKTYPTQLQRLLEAHQAQIRHLLQSNTAFTWDTLIVPLDQLSDELERFWSPISHLHAVSNTPALRDCYEACLPQLSAYDAAIHHNKALYDAIHCIDTHALSPAQQKTLSDTKQTFELAGVLLNDAEKTVFEQLDTELSQLSNQFENNLLDATADYQLHLTDRSRLDGLPAHTIAHAEQLAHEKQLSGWLFTLAQPTYIAIMTYAKESALRESIYTAYHTRASDIGPSAERFDNTPIMVQLLNKKNQLVQMLGFEHYAAYSLATKMLNTPNQVIDFLEDLLHKARPKAEQEYQDLLDFSRIHLHLETLHPWDIAFVSQLKKEHDHTINDEALRAYFPLSHVMQGLFKIIHTLFGIQLREITTSELDTWHPDVRCFALFDSNKNTRGYLYMDLFARPNKRSGAWMDSLQTRYKKPEDSLQLPIATLTCNFANTTGQKPATLSHDEVITLFHEMGHCLHHLLTQVNYLSASGIHGVEWDAVELPSQWFENWCWTAEGMAILSAHIDTGETLPTALLTKLIASQQFQAALGLLRQIELALFDFKLHLHCPQNPDNGLEIAATIPAILSKIQQSTRLTPAPDFLRTAHSFSHIFAGGYAAGYYSYLWAEILSADAFLYFIETGGLNQATGLKFLHEILEVGSTRTAQESYSAFRGKEATLDAFLIQHGITP